MANLDIRIAILSAGLKNYEVAKALNISHVTLTRWLRNELPDDKKQRIYAAIRKISEEKGAK